MSILSLNRNIRRVVCVVFLLTALGACSDQSVESKWQPTQVAVLNLEGQEVNVPKESESVAQVYIFSRVDCPISNRFAVEVERIHQEFGAQNVDLFLVFVDPEETPEIIANHLKEFSYSVPTLRDPKHNLVKLSGAKVTPEAVIFSRRTGLVYRGRIDDRFVDFGKQRNEANHREVREILTALVAGENPEFHETKAIGCYIEELK